MADIKWSAFPNGGAMVSGDQVVGLRSGANTQLTPVTSSQIQSFAFNAAGATGVNDAFVVTLSPAPAALTDGLLITMDSAGLENLTTTPTLKVNSFAAKPIVTFAGAPAPGDIQQNEEYIFVYSLTNDRFQLINPSTTTADTFQVQSSGYSYALDSGVANAYIANILPAQLTTQSGLQIVMTAVNANSGASTLTVNGATHSILLSNGAALTGGEILVNGIYQLFYSSALTAFVLMNPSISITPNSSQSNVTFTGMPVNEYISLYYYYSSLQINNTVYNNLLTVSQLTSQVTVGPLTMNLGDVQAITLYFNLFSFVANGTQTTSLIALKLFHVAVSITLVFPLLTTLNLPLLAYAMFSIAFTGNSLTTFSLPSLVYCGSNISLTGISISTLNLPLLSSVVGSFSSTLPALTTLTLTSLAYQTGAFSPVFASLTNLDLPSLITLGAVFSPSCASCTSVNLSSLQNVVGAVTASFATLATLTFPAIVSFGAAVTFTAANLVTFSLGATLKSVGGNWTMTGMKLNQASVDGILVSLAALDGTGGTTAYSSKTVNLSGGTSATPSATGLAAKAVLVARGCTVTNN